MQVDKALPAKHGRIVTIRMTETCMVAARLLRSENIGVLVVKDSCGTEGDVILGVLSERDILQAVVDHGAVAFAMPISSVMTQDVVSYQSNDTVDRALNIMREFHIRHLPVLHGEALVGVISIRDMLSLAVAAGPLGNEAAGISTLARA